MDYLRFITAGSVDDGKSTLIGRLLYDSEAVQVDLLDAIRRAGQQKGDERVNLALLTDGLKAEREQGITIDVAYKYFSTDKRKFIIADAPGHVQYTRNMITGASTAQLAILLVDARKGVIEQTRRHTYLASLVGVPHIILCINKMDLVDFSATVFENIRADYVDFTRQLGLPDVRCIPIVALDGDNIVHRSEKMDWYDGPTVLEQLEQVDSAGDVDAEPPRLPVQYVIRPQSAGYPDYRGYAGQIVSGVFRPGDAVMALPDGRESVITAIDRFNGTELEQLDYACAPMSVTVRLQDDIDISRGDIIVQHDRKPFVERQFAATICWMDEGTLHSRRRYILQINTRRVPCMITGLRDRLNIHTLERETEIERVEMNDIARVEIKTASPVYFDDYRTNHRTGSFILIDESSNNTVAAGMVEVEPAFQI